MAKDTDPVRGMWEELSHLPRPVQLWMRWFNLLFLAGAFFGVSQEPARWAVLAHLLCFPAAFVLYRSTRDVHLTGAPHLLFWAPLLVVLPQAAADDASFSWLSTYGVWVGLLLPTIAVSLVFDARAIFAFVVRRRL